MNLIYLFIYLFIAAPSFALALFTLIRYRLKRPVSAVRTIFKSNGQARQTMRATSVLEIITTKRKMKMSGRMNTRGERKKKKKKGKKKDGATQTSLFASMYTLCPLADEFIDAGGLLLLPSVCGKMGEAEQQ